MQKAEKRKAVLWFFFFSFPTNQEFTCNADIRHQRTSPAISWLKLANCLPAQITYCINYTVQCIIFHVPDHDFISPIQSSRIIKPGTADRDINENVVGVNRVVRLHPSPKAAEWTFSLLRTLGKMYNFIVSASLGKSGRSWNPLSVAGLSSQPLFFNKSLGVTGRADANNNLIQVYTSLLKCKVFPKLQALILSLSFCLSLRIYCLVLICSANILDNQLALN